MKLKSYIKELQKIAEKYPEAQVVYSADEEGNDFFLVEFEPTIGYFDGNTFSQDETTINAVCVN